MQSIQEYNACSYVRLSKEDLEDGRNESNSITNQNELIKNFLQSHPEIRMVKEYADDGFSGVNFERPNFIRMMEDIKAGVINCVIVKDLSRFGRNYIEVGKYMEEIFPLLGVRFISIVENYDSIKESSGGDQLVIPFMNLVNDAYCGEASAKTRTSLTMKKQKGDYVGPFVVYGYKRDIDNRHRLVIDEDAAIVVKSIFKLFIEGMSNQNIANLLNAEGIPSPLAYKKMQGENFHTSFQRNAQTKWSALAIRRILSNRVYLGILEQGKTYSINYKLKDRLNRNRDDWFCLENAHEEIIPKAVFLIVQKILLLDIRTSPNQDKIYTFSGILHCAECGEVLIRRKTTAKGGTYIYYGCYDKNKKLRCENICIREDFLEKAVLRTLQIHIDTVLEAMQLLETIKNFPPKKAESFGLERLISQKEREIERYRSLKVRLYEDYHDGFISKQEYRDLETVYDRKESEELESLSELTVKRDFILDNIAAAPSWVTYFVENRNVELLNRTMLLFLIDKIIVHSQNDIEIVFSYENEFEAVKEIIENAEMIAEEA